MSILMGFLDLRSSCCATGAGGLATKFPQRTNPKKECLPGIYLRVCDLKRDPKKRVGKVTSKVQG